MEFSHTMIGFLFQRPAKWTKEHIRALNIEEKGTISTLEMVGENIPDEQDPVFQDLSRRFTEPTKEDILCDQAGRIDVEGNHLAWVFHVTHQLSWQSKDSPPFPGGINTIMQALTMACCVLQDVSCDGWSIPFYMPLFRVEGTLYCDGAIGQIPKDANPQSEITFTPLIIYNDVKRSEEEHKTKCVIPYGLFLIGAAFNRNPHREEYASFVISLRHTSLQVTKLVASGSYIRALCQDKPVAEHLEIYQSREFDLLECEDRRDFLMLFMGAINYSLR